MEVQEGSRYQWDEWPVAEGGYGQVFKARDQRSNKTVAVKVLRQEVNRFGHQDVKRELLGAQLSHNNIIRVKDISQRQVMIDGELKQRIVVVSEFIPNDNLFDFVLPEDGELNSMSEEVTRLVMKQLISAVEYCHARPVFHRDIKLDNVMLDEEFNVRLIDFGFATTEMGMLNETAGTEGFQCPQIVKDQPYTGEKMDIFALGVCLFTLRTAMSPFQTAIDKLYKKLMDEPDDYFAMCERSLDLTLDKDFREVLRGMLERDDKKRWTLEKVKNSAWMKGKTATTADLRKMAKKQEDEREQDREENRDQYREEMNNATYDMKQRGKDDWQTEAPVRTASQVNSNTILVNYKPFVIEDLLQTAFNVDNCEADYDRHLITVRNVSFEKMVPDPEEGEFVSVEVAVTVNVQIYLKQGEEDMYFVEFSADLEEGQNNLDATRAIKIVKKQLTKVAVKTNVKLQEE